MPDPIPASRLRIADLLPAGTLGLRTRRLRAILSALGISIGVAAIVGVLGITQSSQSNLISQLDQLGTNMLTVTNGQTFSGGEAELPATATVMIRRIAGVLRAAPTADLAALGVYRNQLVPSGQTGGLAVRACDTSLLPTLAASVWQGRFLNAATERYPVTVLGYQAARTLGITRLDPGTRVWLGGRWFSVSGILRPLPLAPEVGASALVGFPVAGHLLGYDGHPSRIYVRAAQDQVIAVAGLLGPTANPASPEQVTVSRPSDALTARLAVQRSGVALFLGLGAIALVVGGIGIANVMVVAVLERRGEIGLRRALGAARGHIAAQFLTESLVLAAAGGAAGTVIGIGATVTMSYLRNWTTLIPGTAAWGGMCVAVGVGAAAGLYPALRAARLSPTDALRTV
jgi:putative ABC transport system permease protein